MKIQREVLFRLLMLVLSLTLLEFCLTVVANLSPGVELLLSKRGDRVVRDERLILRPSPEFPGHDSKGFRNPNIPADIEIVALGDSQTYGSGVDSSQAWPQQLEQLSGADTYSMAFGGYGPVHSLLLWKEAIDLDPNLIIEAFYSGNDLANSFHMVYKEGHFPELKNPNSEVRAAVQDAEEAEPFRRLSSRIYRMGAPRPPTDQTPSALEPLLDHSRLYRLFWGIQSLLEERSKNDWENARAIAEANPAYREIYEDGGLRTIFTSKNRHTALDVRDIRIAEGNRISLAIMKKMNELASQSGQRFLVLLIPTKEMVFNNLVKNPPANFRALVAAEKQFLKGTKKFLEEHEIAYVDALPALQGQLSLGIQPYPFSQDGHPNPHGHLAIAKTVHAYLATTE